MIKIFIFGTGKCYRETFITLDLNKVKIIGLIDNDNKKQNTFIDGYKVFNPKDILNLEYDYIIIASQYHIDIFEQLIGLGVNHKKIIPIKVDAFYKSYSNETKFKIENIQKKCINRKPKIALSKENNSGSSTFALYKKIPQYIKEKYDVGLIESWKLEENSDFDLVCSTHLSRINNNTTINIELWHGFPLKKVGTMTNQFDSNKYENFRSNIDCIISYSEIYSNLFNAAFPNEYYKYNICGMPRNDLLFNEDKDIFKKIYKGSMNYKKAIMYLPTYRVNKFSHDSKLEGNRKWNNIFGFDEFSLQNLVDFLRENEYIFICKLHPIEANRINKEEFSEFSDVIIFLEESDLYRNEIDLYEVLGNIDMLITDYSSVYFDMLLKNIPLIFVPIDIEYYKKERGFNLEPYDFWAPGSKVLNQLELIKEIKQNFLHDEYYEQRQNVKDIVHYYKDNNSSERIWRLIDKKLKERMLNDK